MNDEIRTRNRATVDLDEDVRMTAAGSIAPSAGHGSIFAVVRSTVGHLVSFVRKQLRLADSGGSNRSRAASAFGHDDLIEKLASAEAELAAKTRLIALTSHELRTPLNGILGMSDLLMRTSLTPEQMSYVQAVATSATSLLSLVDDMLDAGKIAAGRWSLKSQPVVIEGLIEEVVELLAPRAQAKGLELAAHVAAHVPAMVMADPDQIIRILMNLVGNAIKFTQRGGVAVDLSVERRTQADVALALRVRDSGPGIPTEDQGRIFGEYERVNTGIVARQAGTGLGLSISRAIAREMGGDIVLERSSSDGSVFCVRLSLPIVRGAATNVYPFEGRRMLLVSNHSVEPPVLMRRLFDLGASVELVKTAQAGREILAGDRPIDLILFDHDDHLDAADFKASLEASHPPIVVMIAPADRRALDRIRESGIRAHLIKPMRTASLTKVVSKLLTGEALSMDPVSTPRPKPNTTTPADLKILLADDNDINILLGQSLLRSLGQSCEVANDGALAVARATEAMRFGHPYDLILMDLHMPELDGFAAISAIRRAERVRAKHSLIIALSADSSESSSAQAIAAGADLAMVKPIRREDLLKVLERASAATSARTSA